MQAISPGELQSTFTFSTNQLVSNFTNQIAVFQLTFDWEYSLDMGITWLSAGYTQNPCYVAFDYPKPPWGALPVYVEIMELACNGMWGATTAQAAVQQLTPGLHSYLMYDQFMHFSGISIPGDFYVRSFVCRCNGLSSGPAEGNDCRDFANIIKSLTAAVGIDFVNICAFNNNGGPFLTRPIKPAKLSPLNNGTNWSFHQINYEIWGAWWYMIDGSLLLDYDQIDANGWTSPGFLANYNIGWSDYTLRLSNFSLSSIGGWSTISLLEGVRPWNPTPP